MFLFLFFNGLKQEEIVSKFQFDDLIGVYRVYKEEVQTEYENGWRYSKRLERILILNGDSSFLEINYSFEAFDVEDNTGKWNVIDDQLMLTKDQSRSLTEVMQSKKTVIYLEIFSKEEVKIIEHGFLENLFMTRQ